MAHPINVTLPLILSWLCMTSGTSQNPNATIGRSWTIVAKIVKLFFAWNKQRFKTLPNLRVTFDNPCNWLQHCTLIFSYHVNSLFQMKTLWFLHLWTLRIKNAVLKLFWFRIKTVKNVFCNFFYIHFRLLL